MKRVKRFLSFLLAFMLVAVAAYADMELPEQTTVIEEQAFMNDTSLTGILTIPANVTDIGAQAFYNCTDLTGVVFGQMPVNIGSQAFASCTGLSGSTVVVPAGSVVAADAFDIDVTVAFGVPEGYPTVVPEMIQQEHTTITIYDYWSGDGARVEDPSEEQQKLYDYRDWIEATYNVKVEQKQGGDWSTCAEEMINFTSAPDDSLRAYIVEPGKVGSLVGNKVAAPWKNYDLSGSKWNKAMIDLWTLNGETYAVSTGASEPRAMLFFNKRILEESGIDWNSIYDMQKAGTWTWAAFEDVLEKVVKDTDNDGVQDVWGVSGSSDDLYITAVFSNGGTFFDFDANGNLQPTMGSTATRNALKWAQSIHTNGEYWMPTPEDANWDWYKTAWKEGKFAFYSYQAYGGFNDYSEMSGMEDEWGAVAFPVSSAGGNYVTVISENATLIPNVYDEKEMQMIMFFIDLWTNPTPGVDNTNSWIGNKYNYTDRRAVNETYGMLRKSGHGVGNRLIYLGDQNSILGASLLWNLTSGHVDDLIEASMPVWQSLCNTFNGN